MLEDYCNRLASIQVACFLPGVEFSLDRQHLLPIRLTATLLKDVAHFGAGVATLRSSGSDQCYELQEQRAWMFIWPCGRDLRLKGLEVNIVIVVIEFVWLESHLKELRIHCDAATRCRALRSRILEAVVRRPSYQAYYTDDSPEF